MLNFKVMDSLIWWRKLQGSTAWVSLAASSQVYKNEDCEQKSEWKGLKHLEFAQKSAGKLRAKESVAAEEMRAIKKKLVRCINSKDSLMPGVELQDLILAFGVLWFHSSFLCPHFSLLDTGMVLKVCYYFTGARS
jgi:hypothetical protein